jgi:hypothetical protein
MESYRFTPILVAYSGWLKWLNHQKFSFLGKGALILNDWGFKKIS